MGIGNEYIGAVESLLLDRVIGSRTLFRMSGPWSMTWQAEKEVEALLRIKHVLLVPSATVGLALILDAVSLRPGMNVVCATFGWLSNWSILARAGLHPKFVSTDENLQIPIQVIQEAIDENTIAVIATHMMGRGQRGIEEIAQLCERENLYLLEDISQSFGVSVSGQRAGTFGLASFGSFNHHKLLSCGDGGFIGTNDSNLFDRICALHDQGCILRSGSRSLGDRIDQGLSLRMTDLTGAVLRGQLTRFNSIRTRILVLHEAIKSEIEGNLGWNCLTKCDGDIPFTVVFEKPKSLRYPSLFESGWHVAENVPWLTNLDERTKAVFRETNLILSKKAIVGSGLVDLYLGASMGVEMKKNVYSVESLVEDLMSLI